GFVNLLGGADVGGGAAMVLGDGVEEDGVYVVADAESEEADVGGGGAGDGLEEGGGVGDAFGGEAVGEEDEGGWPVGAGLVDGFEEGLADVGAADGFEAVDEAVVVAGI